MSGNSFSDHASVWTKRSTAILVNSFRVFLTIICVCNLKLTQIIQLWLEIMTWWCYIRFIFYTVYSSAIDRRHNEVLLIFPPWWCHSKWIKLWSRLCCVALTLMFSFGKNVLKDFLGFGIVVRVNYALETLHLSQTILRAK